MQKAVEDFGVAVNRLGIKSADKLGGRRHRDRLKYLRQVAKIIFRVDVAIKPDRHGHLVLRIRDNELSVMDMDESEDEAAAVLHEARAMHLSMRNIYRLRRSCRRSTLRRVRKSLLPYRPRLVTFQPGLGRERAGSVVDLRELVEARVVLAEAAGCVQMTRGDSVWVIIAFDGTQVWKSGITRCDVFVDLYGDKTRARLPSSWSTWFIFDGPDDAGPLCIADRRAKLNSMVVELEANGLEIFGKRYKVICFVTGDGKGMIAANPRSGCKCWWCAAQASRFGEFLAAHDIPLDRIASLGGFLISIPPVRRIGDLVHGALRTVNCVMKRLSTDERVTGVRGLQTALRAKLSEIASDAAHIPSDMRLQPMAAKPGQMDITTCQAFLKQPNRFQEISELLKAYMGVVVVGGAPFHVIVLRMFAGLAFMNKLWRQAEELTDSDVSRYSRAVDQLGRDMGTLGWKPAHWCHWVLVHSVQVAKLWRNFSIFSSVPTERRHIEFKMDIRHCFQGYKLSKVALARRFAQHLLEMDALDMGLRLWVAHKVRVEGDKKKTRGVKGRLPRRKL